MRNNLAAACLLLAVAPAVAASGGIYLAAISTENGEVWLVDGETIRPAAADHKSAVIFIIKRGLQGDFGKYDFDCKASRARQISLRHYVFGAIGAIETSKDMTPEPEGPAVSGTLLGQTTAYVCGSPATLQKDSPIPKISNDAATTVLTLARVFGKTFKEK